jgi:hypothetical protein
MFLKILQQQLNTALIHEMDHPIHMTSSFCNAN